MANVNLITLGSEQVWPDEGYNWQLYKETNFKNSSFGDFRLRGRPSGSTSPTNINFNTSEGYIYTTQSSYSMVTVSPKTSDYDLFNNSKAIKIICDGIWIANNTNTYTSRAGIMNIWFGRSSSGRSGNYQLESGSMPPLGTWCKAEAILYKDSGTAQLTIEGAGTFTNSNFNWSYLVTTNQKGFFYSGDDRAFIYYLFLDQGTSSRMKDVHVYIAN